MHYLMSHFNWKDSSESILLTNDMGKYCFLSPEDFSRFINYQLKPEDSAFQDLKRLGFLYFDQQQFISEFKDDLFEMKECLLSATQLLILVLTDACNQRCVYCQAGENNTHRASLEVCKKAIDLAVQSPVSSMTIEFQGGEPTLNPEALRFSIPYAKKVFAEKGKRVEFSIVTNLTNPDPFLLRWLIEQDVHISTSLDGNQHVHDYNRPLSNQKSSYDAWHAGAELYKRLCKELHKTPIISAIQTTTKESLKYPIEIIDEYLSNGIDHLYIRPLTPLGFALMRWPDIGYSSDEYLSFYYTALDYMMNLCKQGRYVVESTASIYLRRIITAESVAHTEFRSPCGAGVGQLAVNYDGNVYTCDEGRMIANMGDRIFQLGTVNSSYNEIMQSPALHAVCSASCVECLPFCSDCVYAPYCAVCPVVNYGIEKDLVSHEKNGYRCKISQGIISRLFDLIYKGDPIELEILKRWAED